MAFGIQRYGFPPNHPHPPCPRHDHPLSTPDALGRTPLLAAVEANDLPTATRLIAAGANLNAQAANKDTPWLQAGALGRTEMLSVMLDKGGVDYAVRNRYGGNALIPACERGHVDTVKLLLENAPKSTSITSMISAAPACWKP